MTAAKTPTGQAYADLDVFVAGKPISQGSKTRTKFGMRESSKDLAPWRARLTFEARQAYGVARAPIARTVPVQMDLHFVMPRPASTPKRSTPPAIRMPDLDKCIRAVGDALTGVAFMDDAQVTQITASKRIAEIDEGPGVRIRIWGAAS